MLSRRHFLATAGGAGSGLLMSRSALAGLYDHYPTIADSVRDFSATQGYDGWHYGYAAAPYAVETFEPLMYFADDAWHTDPALPRLTATGGATGTHCAVRRWVSTADDKVVISGDVGASSPDAIRASIYADGRLLWTEQLDHDSSTATFTVQLRLAVGMLIDFVVEPGASSAAEFRFTAVVGQGGCNNCCFAEPANRIRQTQLPWGPQLYDHKLLSEPRHTIGDVGCALCCLSMGLHYAGFLNTPSSLNTLLTGAGGYDPKTHTVRFREAVMAARAASGKQLKWIPHTTSDLSSLPSVICGSQSPIPGVFNAGFPIIAGVQRKPKANMPFVADHYVLVIGYSNNPFLGERYNIIDPIDGAFTLLTRYGNQFLGRGYVIDPPGEVSGLNVDVDDAALFITDPAGRTTGFDPATGPVTGIPLSVACGDSLSGDLTATQADNFSSSVNIEDPLAGSFTLAITAVTTGMHTLSIRGYSNDGTAQPEVLVTIDAAAGETVLVDVGYSPEPGSVPQLVKSVTVKILQQTVNLASHGVIPVAILSTETFDATTIDPATVRFGPAAAAEAHGRGHVEDAGGDGRPDLVLHFRVNESGIAANATEVCLTGRTFAGAAIRGCAAIRVR